MIVAQCKFGRRRGLTLIEVIATLGMIALLISILLPAVLRATESARRLQCASRLGELAKACHAFHGTHQHLPKTSTYAWVPAYPNMFSVWTHLLPYLDQGNVFSVINRAEDGGTVYPEPPLTSHNHELVKLTLPMFVCPTDISRSGACNVRVSLGSDYVRPRAPLHGVFSDRLLSRGARLSDVTDGLSQTALCSEKLIGDWEPSNFDPPRDLFFVSPISGPAIDVDTFVGICAGGFVPGAAHVSHGGSTWMFNGFRFTAYNHVQPPNSKLPDCSEFAPHTGGRSSGIHSARSLHTNGVNVAFADGASRFVNQSIDLAIWRAIGTRAGSEAIVQR